MSGDELDSIITGGGQVDVGGLQKQIDFFLADEVLDNTPVADTIDRMVERFLKKTGGQRMVDPEEVVILRNRLSKQIEQAYKNNPEADDENRADFLDMGMPQYTYGKDNARKLNFFQAPPDVLEDEGVLLDWVTNSMNAALRGKT